ncbi:MAG: Rrf2 family transcriptional regulator [Planctomycetota bacterium]|nr:Rrf2 family transcriptional regulator [Planctomycetota bacterium]
MKLSRTVAYAVQASLHLAKENSSEPVPCSRLAAEGQMPERFLLQILRNLVAHGILTSTRGVDGGYSLGRDADEISLLDIIEAIDGPLAPNLPLGEGLPAESRSRLKEAISDVTEESRRQLATINLVHLLPKPAVELVGKDAE